jgi:hypothetical protein
LLINRIDPSAQPDPSFFSAFVRKAGMVGTMKPFRTTIVLFATFTATLSPVVAAKGSDLALEYEQVKKIALKDPKVRAAFDRANEMLDKRMIQIYPALKPYIEAQRARIKRSERAAKSAPALQSTAGRTHIVAKGETLTSIARRYKVNVDSLARVNDIAKEGTLRVGQKLAIPSMP